ncbi:MAG: hypothetical protein Q8L43_00460 [Deltaproteobacteria bacterium]|nr:hypothetical protein [Deltaproteobacteria bacterium]
MTDKGRYPRDNNASARVTTRLGAVFPLLSFTSFSAKNVSYAIKDLLNPLSGLWSSHQGPTCGAMTSILLLKIHAKKKKGRVAACLID